MKKLRYIGSSLGIGDHFVEATTGAIVEPCTRDIHRKSTPASMRAVCATIAVAAVALVREAALAAHGQEANQRLKPHRRWRST